MDSPIMERQKMEDAYNAAQMQVIEANQILLKMFTVFSILIAMVSLLISLAK